MGDDSFGFGLVVGAFAIIVVFVVAGAIAHTYSVNERWSLYISCVESEKVDYDFCAESYRAPKED